VRHTASADDRISLVTTHSRCKARRGLRSRGGPLALANAREKLLPAGPERPSANTPMQAFRDSTTFRGSITCSLCTSPPFCAYASSTPLPECLQGSIPGPWLAVTWAGFAPARLRGIAKPRPPVASGWSGLPGGIRTHWKAPPYHGARQGRS